MQHTINENNHNKLTKAGVSTAFSIQEIAFNTSGSSPNQPRHYDYDTHEAKLNDVMSSDEYRSLKREFGEHVRGGNMNSAFEIADKMNALKSMAHPMRSHVDNAIASIHTYRNSSESDQHDHNESQEHESKLMKDHFSDYQSMFTPDNPHPEYGHTVNHHESIFRQKVQEGLDSMDALGENYEGSVNQGDLHKHLRTNISAQYGISPADPRWSQIGSHADIGNYGRAVYDAFTNEINTAHTARSDKSGISDYGANADPSQHMPEAQSGVMELIGDLHYQYHNPRKRGNAKKYPRLDLRKLSFTPRRPR